MKTELLYYNDINKFEFNAKIIDKKQVKDKYHIILDKTMFYPESGGMNCDLGYLNDVKVISVKHKDDYIIHITNQDIVDINIVGKIDKQRRYRNIQNHDAQHILTALFIKDYNLKTVSEHAYDTYCDIDLEGEMLTDEILVEIQDKANKLILENRRVDILDIYKKDFNKYGIEDNPNYSDPARITNIEGIDDYNACACLHFDSLGYVQAIKCLGFEKHNNGYRMFYVAGKQLVEYLDTLDNKHDDIIKLIDSNSNKIIDDISKLVESNIILKTELDKLKELYYNLEVDSMKENEFILYENNDMEIKDLKLMAEIITSKEKNLTVLLQTNITSNYQYIIVKSKSSSYDIDDLFNSLRKDHQLKGGKKNGIISGQANDNVIEILKKSYL